MYYLHMLTRDSNKLAGVRCMSYIPYLSHLNVVAYQKKKKINTLTQLVALKRFYFHHNR